MAKRESTINVDEEGEIAQKYGIMSIPALLVFKGGQVVDQMVGSDPRTALRRLSPSTFSYNGCKFEQNASAKSCSAGAFYCLTIINDLASCRIASQCSTGEHDRHALAPSQPRIGDRPRDDHQLEIRPVDAHRCLSTSISDSRPDLFPRGRRCAKFRVHSRLQRIPSYGA